MYVRLKKNNRHYQIQGAIPTEDIEELVEYICTQGIRKLQENDLVTLQDHLKSSELGEIMAKYSIQFETMVSFMALTPKASSSEIVSVPFSNISY